MKKTIIFYSIVFFIFTLSKAFSFFYEDTYEYQRHFTPLHKAAVDGNLEEIKSLIIFAGQNPRSKDVHGWTPFHIAAQKDNSGMIDALLVNQQGNASDFLKIKNDLGNTPFQIAAYNGHVNVMTRLIEWYDEGKNIEGCYGFRPLHTAVSHGHFNVVKLLCEKGAQTNIMDNNGCTPLHLASLNNQLNIARYLIDMGADFTARSIHGGTFLHFIRDDFIFSSLVEFLNTKWWNKYTTNYFTYNVFDCFGKKPIDLTRTYSRALFKNQMEGDSGLTSTNWQVSVFFKQWNYGPFPLDHTHIAFENLNNLEDWRAGDTKSRSTLRVAHLRKEGGVEIIEPGCPRKKSDGSVQSAEEYANKESYSVFSWSIPASLGAKVWEKIKSEKSSIQFAFFPNWNSKPEETHNCATYVVGALGECGLKIPGLNYQAGVRISSSELIKTLENNYSK